MKYIQRTLEHIFTIMLFIIVAFFYHINLSASEKVPEIDSRTEGNRAHKVKWALVNLLPNQDGSLSANIEVSSEMEGMTIYSNKLGDVGFPLSISLNSSKSLNIRNIEINWPISLEGSESDSSKKGEFFKYFYYKLPVNIPIKIYFDHPNASSSISLLLDYGFCIDGSCFRESDKIEKNILSYKRAQKIDSFGRLPKIDKLLYYCFLALLGGISLNIMPCVLPVVSLKLLGLFKYLSLSRGALYRHIFFIVSGIMSLFIFLGIFACFCRYIGTNFGWGMHFQSPGFIFLLIIVVLFFINSSVNSNIYIGLPHFLSNWFNKISNTKSEYLSTFIFGFSVTLLATPCSAPFISSALAFCFSQGYLTIMLIHFSMGLGLALPYLFLMCFPKLIYLIPKSVRFAEIFKLIMAFPLVATYIWLLYVLGKQLSDSLYQIFVWLTLIIQIFMSRHIINKFFRLIEVRVGTIDKKENYFKSLIIVLYENITPFNQGWDEKIKWILRTTMLIIPFLMISYVPQKVTFLHTYTEKSIIEEINVAKKDNDIVIVTVTADWCITCKINENIINKFVKRQEKMGRKIGIIKLDYTNKSGAIWTYMGKYRAYAIPLTVIYSKNTEKELAFKSIITEDTLLSAKKRLEK